MPVKLPRFDRSVSLVDSTAGTPSTAFHQWWQKVVVTLEGAFNTLEAAVIDIQAAITAAGIAQAAADTAQAAADAAQAAADAAQDTGSGAEAIASLSNSGVSGVTITATDVGLDVTINVSAHTRLYGNGDSVSVNSGDVTGRAYSTLYYIYYDDPARTGGAVTYNATTSEATAAQTGNRHLVGLVTTPAAAAGPTGGKYVKPPGAGSIEP